MGEVGLEGWEGKDVICSKATQILGCVGPNPDSDSVPPAPATLTPVLREGKGAGVKLLLSSHLTQV